MFTFPHSAWPGVSLEDGLVKQQLELVVLIAVRNDSMIHGHEVTVH